MILFQCLFQTLFVRIDQRLRGKDSDVGDIRKQDALQFGVNFDVDANI